MDLHFGLGENFCSVIAQIAREKIQYDFDLEAAVRVFTDNLGCDREQALQLISGRDYALYVDKNGDSDLMMCDRSSLPKDKEYPVFEATEMCDWWLETIEREAKHWQRALERCLTTLTIPPKKVDIDFSAEINVDSLLEAFVHDRPEDIKDQLYQRMVEMIEDSWDHGDRAFLKVKNLLKTMRFALDWIKEATNKIRIIKELSANGIIDKDGKNIQDYLDLVPMAVSDVFSYCTQAMQSMQSAKASDEYKSLLDEYIKAESEISTQLKYNIYPTDITKNFDAGWLSPTGAFYGMNGTIANMLHIQIADKLYDQGFIPHDDITNAIEHKDSWLEANGWIRIHGDEIAFWPSKHLTEARIPTKQQIDKLVEYAKKCHHGTLRNLSNQRMYVKASVLKQADDIQLKRMFDPYYI